MSAGAAQRKRSPMGMGLVAGAIAGGIAAALILARLSSPLYGDPYSEAVAYGLCGAVAGGIGGALAGGRTTGGWSAIGLGSLAGLGTGIVACLLAIAAVWAYTDIPWPAPSSYPGTAVRTEYDGGSRGQNRIQAYSVGVASDTVEQHYVRQMSRYCVSEWDFVQSAAQPGLNCREAQCEVRRPGMPESFWVRVCTRTTNETDVVQIVSWQR